MRNYCAFVVVPILLSLFFINNIHCNPISQPGQENPHYIAAQSVVPTLTYKPQQLIHYKPAAAAGQTRVIYESKTDGLQYYATQNNQQQQQQLQKTPQSIQAPGYAPVRQVFVPTNQGPREIDPSYYDQYIKAQQQQQQQQRPHQQQQQQQSYQQPQQQVKYVPQPVQIKYVPQPIQYSSKYQSAAAVAQNQKVAKKNEDDGEEDEDEAAEGDYDPNPSYQFGFDVKDDQYTNYQTRKEERDGKVIKGSYSVVDADGYIRTVKYTADPKEGFKAEVSREPTDIKIKIPKPVPQYQSLPKQYPQQLQAARAQVQHQPQYIQVGTQRIQSQQQQQRGQQQEDENVVYQQQYQ